MMNPERAVRITVKHSRLSTPNKSKIVMLHRLFPNTLFAERSTSITIMGQCKTVGVFGD